MSRRSVSGKKYPRQAAGSKPTCHGEASVLFKQVMLGTPAKPGSLSPPHSLLSEHEAFIMCLDCSPVLQDQLPGQTKPLLFNSLEGHSCAAGSSHHSLNQAAPKFVVVFSTPVVRDRM